MKRKNNKAQHEIVGFILIVIIVVIIGLFLLVSYLRDEPVKYQSLNAQNFLQSSMQYTTSCSLSIEPLDIQDLIKSCYKNDQCSDDKMACEVLNETLSELVHESWLVSADRPENAYFLTIYYEEGENAFSEEILYLEEGNCTGTKTSAEHLLHYNKGNIVIIMELCYT
jgi:hypothetical protein